MKIILLLLLSLSCVTAEEVQIRSLKSYNPDSPTSIPVLLVTDESKPNLIIEFDAICEFQPDLTIHFQFCDRNWDPVESVFFINPGYNKDANLSFDQLPSFSNVEGYHCKGRFPNKFVTFPYSGKYLYTIRDSFDQDIIYAEGYFYVVYPEIELSSRFSEDEIDEYPYEFNSLNRTLRLTTDFSVPFEMESGRIKEVEIIENQKLFFPYIISTEKTSNARYYEGGAGSEFRFVARDIRPGNEYRQVDLMNSTKYSGSPVEAHFDGPETSRFFYRGAPDNNGSYRFKKYDAPYSNYMDVNFKLIHENKMNKDIFIVGSFTDWMLWPENKLINNNGTYYCQFELKRGVYDYQYVTGVVDGDYIVDVNWFQLEGNFLETRNEYHVFLFYNDPENGGYDKIIGYNKITSSKYE